MNLTGLTELIADKIEKSLAVKFLIKNKFSEI